jgi:hypothetical protein
MSKSYHTKATGAALETAQKHGEDESLKLFGSCFWYLCPSAAVTFQSETDFCR